MGRQTIERSARTAAAPSVVYALLRDGSTWPAWAPVTRFELERPGPDDRPGEPEGVGAVRVFVQGRVRGRDEVTGFEPDRSFTYRNLSGLPLRDHEGRVDLAPDGDGTRIVWRVSFDGRWPGTGPLLRLALLRFYRDTVDGLARHAPRV